MNQSDSLHDTCAMISLSQTKYKKVHMYNGFRFFQGIERFTIRWNHLLCLRVSHISSTIRIISAPSSCVVLLQIKMCRLGNLSQHIFVPLDVTAIYINLSFCFKMPNSRFFYSIIQAHLSF